MSQKKLLRSLVAPAIVVAVAASLWSFRGSLFPKRTDFDEVASPAAAALSEHQVLELSQQARKNLRLESKPERPTDYWRTVTIPAVVQDRPGVSDRKVTSPAVGVISEIHAYPGDTIQPGENLITIRLLSEYLQTTQTQLFKATREIALLQSEIDRVSGLANTGAVSGNRLIELNNNVTRQTTIVESARQELISRGLSPRQIEQVESGDFVSTIRLVAPLPQIADEQGGNGSGNQANQSTITSSNESDPPIAYEVQGLAVELGQSIQPGQLIASLANHHLLYIVGHAFNREAEFLAQAAEESRPVEVEFSDDSTSRWPPLNQTFRIRHLSNSIDFESRTFDFFVPLANQSRKYGKDGERFFVWRFRPGQRARIYVPVEKLPNVFVLPAEAVAHAGPNAYVYRQNGGLFNQISVHVLHEDRRNVIIANDGNMTPGAYFVQNAAASLNRILKAQSASGEPSGMHVHPDGTVHATH